MPPARRRGCQGHGAQAAEAFRPHQLTQGAGGRPRIHPPHRGQGRSWLCRRAHIPAEDLLWARARRQMPCRTVLKLTRAQEGGQARACTGHQEAAVSQAGGGPALREFAEEGKPGAGQGWEVHVRCEKERGSVGCVGAHQEDRGGDRVSWTPKPSWRRRGVSGEGALQEQVWGVLPFALAEHPGCFPGPWEPQRAAEQGDAVLTAPLGQVREERGCEEEWAAPEVLGGAGEVDRGHKVTSQGGPAGLGLETGLGLLLCPLGPPGLQTQRAHLQWPHTRITPAGGSGWSAGPPVHRPRPPCCRQPGPMHCGAHGLRGAVGSW